MSDLPVMCSSGGVLPPGITKEKFGEERRCCTLAAQTQESLMRSRYLAVFAAMLSVSLYAHADQIFTLSGVTFSSLPTGGTPEGTLTGTFTTNNALNSIVSYDITASASGSFAGFEYTPLDSSVTSSSLPLQYFQLDAPLGGPATEELRLYFTSGLSASGGTISSSFSYEDETIAGGIRYPSGSVVAGSASSVTPEPSSMALLGTGLLGVAGVVKRRFA